MRGALLGFLVMLALGAGGSVAARVLLLDAAAADPAAASAPVAAFERKVGLDRGGEPDLAAPEAESSKPAVSPAMPGLDVASGRDLVFGEPVALPPDTVVLIVGGCSQCDGPPEALWRVLWAGEGPVRVEKVFEADRSHYPDSEVVVYDFNRATNVVTAVVCTVGYCGGLGWPSVGAEITVFTSGDLGSTWSVQAVMPAIGWARGVTERGLVAWTQDREAVLLPAGEVVAQPEYDGDLFPIVFESRLFWRTEDGRLLTGVGEAVTPPEGPGAVREVVFEGDRVAALSWSERPPETRAGAAFHLTSFLGGLVQTFDVNIDLMPAAVLEDRYVVVRQSNFDDPQTPIIALLDTQTGVAHPMPELGDRRFGRGYVLAFVRGGFSRIVAEGCAWVRTAPRLQSEAVACAAEGSLVTETGQRRRFRGQDWVVVGLADGRSGWVRAQDVGR